jgi:hypothetical protein
MRDLLILLFATACATNGAKPMTDNLPKCTTLAQCKQHEGQRVQIVGEYAVWDPLPVRAKDQPPARQVLVKFADGSEGPYLGAWGEADHMRPLDEIAKLGGKRVRVVGTFRSAMPKDPSSPPQAASLDGPCVHPIETIALE